jgi:DNA repair protein RecO (recombination protein O)
MANSTQTDRGRVDNEPAFVLHSYAFRETSMVVETFTREHGRVALLAKGARRPRSVLRGLLLAFQPLAVAWSGRNELRVLHKADWSGGQPLLQGPALMCGFYLNELLLKLLVRDDPHERLFDRYREALQRLAQEPDPGGVLREFEKNLLQEAGYALLLDREAGSGAAIAPEKTYTYQVERGPVAARGDEVLLLSGRTLIDVERGDFSDPRTQQQSKLLMRMLLTHHLGNQRLFTPQLYRELQQI